MSDQSSNPFLQKPTTVNKSHSIFGPIITPPVNKVASHGVFESDSMTTINQLSRTTTRITETIVNENEMTSNVFKESERRETTLIKRNQSMDNNDEP